VRARQTNESKCNRPEDSDGLSDTHSGRVSAARGARDEHSTFARDGFLVLKVTQSRHSEPRTRRSLDAEHTCDNKPLREARNQSPCAASREVPRKAVS
jgi:hypothetical protein